MDAGFLSFGEIGIFEYYFGEMIFDVINVANGAAGNGRRTLGQRVAIHWLVVFDCPPGLVLLFRCRAFVDRVVPNYEGNWVGTIGWFSEMCNLAANAVEGDTGVVDAGSRLGVFGNCCKR